MTSEYEPMVQDALGSWVLRSERPAIRPVPRVIAPSGRSEWVDDITIPDEPPPMALPPLMLDEGPTVLFGMGESKKSVLAQLVASSLANGSELVPGWTPTVTGPVLWLDYENSRRRVARRQRLIGPAPILYIPCVKPIWDDVADLSAEAQRIGAVAVVVDSIVAATAGGALSTKDPEAAAKYYGAVNQIAPRSLSLAHITKDGAEAVMPFGSVFFHNLARLTWRTRVDDRGRVTLTNHKHTDGDRLPSTTLAFDFGEDYLRVAHASAQLTTAVLVDLITETMTTGQIIKVIEAEGYNVGRSWLMDLLRTAVGEHRLSRPERGSYGPGDRTTTGHRPISAFAR